MIPLTAAGCENPRLDAEVLLAAAMGVDRPWLIVNSREGVPGPAARVFMDFVRRRREREPVAYITGIKGFRHIDLAVDRRVLIPRPETEFVVEAALKLPQGARVIDVGTGSGAIALALKHERPDLDVVATDVSADALDVARHNALRLGLRVGFVQTDLWGDLEADAIVSNPPYVEAGERLMPDVALFEPHGALFAGADGLDVIRRLVSAPVRFLALEHGQGQADPIEALLRGAGFTTVDRIRDLAGIERVTVAHR
ncbi:peptide chain release factor N(5)-glutamine methyltransferase [Solirubrobacter sp. CPCC 204708]|nr:peptide chain release factor N(5)-glutamine methyltransferase [Solirubrobacter deserti]